ncbi:hypothetical protein CWI37_0899p0020 [Hamiltosporidium tvaerminnensis]|uniref:Protein HIR n=1 Tax=Hamiltosporidium tvaerminnensis TaxID=1176355 RepID=A0A4Q9L1D3_9MICR|nr:Protein hir2 [Hamiltosporidium tvaerminnensis]TBU00795.1 hypothetical protein CWI37_0899p0020 [Hamiltosporidium tvaerminnensis]
MIISNKIICHIYNNKPLSIFSVATNIRRITVTSSLNGEIKIWNKDFSKSVSIVNHSGSVLCVRFSYDNKYLVTSGDDNYVCVMREESRSEVGDSNKECNSISKVGCKLDNRVGSNVESNIDTKDNTNKDTDNDTNNYANKDTNNHTDNRAEHHTHNHANIHTNNNLNSYKLFKKFKHHSSDVNSLEFSNDFLFTGGCDLKVNIYKLGNFDLIYSIKVKHPIKGITVDRNSKYFLIQNENKLIIYKILNNVRNDIGNDVRNDIGNNIGNDRRNTTKNNVGNIKGNITKNLKIVVFKTIEDIFYGTVIESFFCRMSFSPDCKYVGVGLCFNNKCDSVEVLGVGKFNSEFSFIGHVAPIEVVCFNPYVYKAMKGQITLGNRDCGEIEEGSKSVKREISFDESVKGQIEVSKSNEQINEDKDQIEEDKNVKEQIEVSKSNEQINEAKRQINGNKNIKEQRNGDNGQIDDSFPYYVVAVASQDKSISLWNSLNEKPFVLLKNVSHQPVLDMCWSSDGNVLYFVSYDGYLRRIEFKENELGEKICKESVEETIPYEIGRYSDNIDGDIDKKEESIGIKKEESNGFKKEIKKVKIKEIKNEIDNEIKNQTKNEIIKGINNEIKNEFKNELNKIKEINNEIKNEITIDIKDTKDIKDIKDIKKDETKNENTLPRKRIKPILIAPLEDNTTIKTQGIITSIKESFLAIFISKKNNFYETSKVVPKITKSIGEYRIEVKNLPTLSSFCVWKNENIFYEIESELISHVCFNKQYFVVVSRIVGNKNEFKIVTDIRNNEDDKDWGSNGKERGKSVNLYETINNTNTTDNNTIDNKIDKTTDKSTDKTINSNNIKTDKTNTTNDTTDNIHSVDSISSSIFIYSTVSGILIFPCIAVSEVVMCDCSDVYLVVLCVDSIFKVWNLKKKKNIIRDNLPFNGILIGLNLDKKYFLVAKYKIKNKFLHFFYDRNMKSWIQLESMYNSIYNTSLDIPMRGETDQTVLDLEYKFSVYKHVKDVDGMIGIARKAVRLFLCSRCFNEWMCEKYFYIFKCLCDFDRKKEAFIFLEEMRCNCKLELWVVDMLERLKRYIYYN